MTVLSSAIDTRSDTFKKNAEAMRALVADLKARTDRVRLGGGEESRKRHVARGKLAEGHFGVLIGLVAPDRERHVFGVSARRTEPMTSSMRA